MREIVTHHRLNETYGGVWRMYSFHGRGIKRREKKGREKHLCEVNSTWKECNSEK